MTAHDADVDPYHRLSELGIELTVNRSRFDWFNPVRRSGDLLFTSGQISVRDGEPVARGLLGADVDVEAGQASARQAMANVLALVHDATGDLRLWRGFKLLIAGACTPGFTRLGEVANGASLLLVDVFGPDHGSHARTALSMPTPAHGACVEVEAIFQLR